ncbi:MAG: hypothetical protein HPZ91_13565 [Lentisphaeria bacterium]|nr:hypothetical protein [Lentisphaeria bacterium]
MKRYIGLAVAVLFTVFSGGCGYRIGSVMHPQIKTVAVAPVQNETVEYNLTAQVRNLLCERFMTDGSLKLVDEKVADCIVYARIIDVKFAEVSWAKKSRTDNDNDIFLPNEWRVTLTIEYSVIIPGRVQPLISARKVSGTANFQTGPDQMIGRMNGVGQAAYDAAKQVVSSFTEGW